MRIVIDCPADAEIMRAALYVNDKTWTEHPHPRRLLGAFSCMGHVFSVTRIKDGIKARYIKTEVNL